MRKRVTGSARVRVRLACLFDEAIDQAVGFACRRAFKHRSEPIAGPDELVALLTDNLRSDFWRALDELGVEVDR